MQDALVAESRRAEASEKFQLIVQQVAPKTQPLADQIAFEIVAPAIRRAEKNGLIEQQKRLLQLKVRLRAMSASDAGIIAEAQELRNLRFGKSHEVGLDALEKTLGDITDHLSRLGDALIREQYSEASDELAKELPDRSAELRARIVRIETSAAEWFEGAAAFFVLRHEVYDKYRSRTLKVSVREGLKAARAEVRALSVSELKDRLTDGADALLQFFIDALDEIPLVSLSRKYIYSPGRRLLGFRKQVVVWNILDTCDQIADMEAELAAELSSIQEQARSVANDLLKS